MYYSKLMHLLEDHIFKHPITSSAPPHIYILKLLVAYIWYNINKWKNLFSQIYKLTVKRNNIVFSTLEWYIWKYGFLVHTIPEETVFTAI